MKCFNCHATLEDGARFCPLCGKAQPSQHPAQPAQSAPLPARQCGPAEPSGAGETGTGRFKPPFNVSVALPEAMQVDRRALVVVRFRAFGDIYESVEIVLRAAGTELARAKCGAGSPSTALHELPLQIVPKTAGTAGLMLDVVCDSCEVHRALLQITVDDKNGPALFSPVFNINQTQTSDRVGDTKGGNVNVNIDGINLPKANDPKRYETNPGAQRPVETRLFASPAAITLASGEDVIQIVSANCVTFGKNRDTTVPLRLCDESGRVELEKTRHSISGYHFSIENTDGNFVVRDGGHDPKAMQLCINRPSSYGTRLDGIAVPPAGTRTIGPVRELNLAIGRPDAELGMKLFLYRDSRGRPAGFRIDRHDGARQTILAVWRGVPVERDRKIVWNGSCWQLFDESDPDSSVPLAIGAKVAIAGRRYEVRPYYQTYIH